MVQFFITVGATNWQLLHSILQQQKSPKLRFLNPGKLFFFFQ